LRGGDLESLGKLGRGDVGEPPRDRGDERLLCHAGGDQAGDKNVLIGLLCPFVWDMLGRRVQRLLEDVGQPFVGAGFNLNLV
jgi:hypothetical protein